MEHFGKSHKIKAKIKTWPEIYVGLEKVLSSHPVQVDSPSGQETFHSHLPDEQVQIANFLFSVITG